MIFNSCKTQRTENNNLINDKSKAPFALTIVKIFAETTYCLQKFAESHKLSESYK